MVQREMMQHTQIIITICRVCVCVCVCHNIIITLFYSSVVGSNRILLYLNQKIIIGGDLKEILLIIIYHYLLL